MGYTFPVNVRFIRWSPRYHILFCVYESSDIQAWNPFSNNVLYHLRKTHMDIGYDDMLVSFSITAFVLNEITGRFLTGASNGSIRMRYISTGCLIDEFRMVKKSDPRVRKGGIDVRFINESADQLVFGGQHDHLVQFDKVYEAHRTWNQQTSPVLLGASLDEARMMVTLHDNGDLIFWQLAYREKWVAHNVMNHLKLKTVGVKSKGIREGLKKDPPKGLSTSSDVVPIAALFWLSRNRKALDQSVGTVLLVPSSTVRVQVWNLHGFVDQFATASELNQATLVTCAAIDDSERFLFLGSPCGYVRTFYVEAFANPTATASLSWVRLRLIFPYLWRTLHKTIPERKARPLAQPTVPLVNCYRAHVGGVIAMVYAESKRILFTAGSDHTVRMWHLSGTFLSALGPSADLYLMPGVNHAPYSFPPPPYRLPMFVRNPMAGGIKLGERKVFLREWRKELEPVENDDDHDSVTDAKLNIGVLGGAEEYDNVRKEYEEGDLGMLPDVTGGCKKDEPGVCKKGDSKNRRDTTAQKQGKSKNLGGAHSKTALLLGTHKQGKLKTSHIVHTALTPLIRMMRPKESEFPRKTSCSKSPASPKTKTRPKISDLIRQPKRIWQSQSTTQLKHRLSSSSSPMSPLKSTSKKRPIDYFSKYRLRSSSSRSNSGSKSTCSPFRFSGSKTSSSSRSSPHQRNHIPSESRSPKKNNHSPKRVSGSKSSVCSANEMPSRRSHSSSKRLLSPTTYQYRVGYTPAPIRAGCGDCDNRSALDFMGFGDLLKNLSGDWASRLQESVNYENDIKARKDMVCSDLVKLMIEEEDDEEEEGRGELEEEGSSEEECFEKMVGA